VSRRALAWLTTALLAITWGFTVWVGQRLPEPLRRPLDSLPIEIAGWRGEAQPPLDRDILAVLEPSAYLSRLYTRGGREIQLFVAYYDIQRTGGTMHSPRNCLPGSGWEVWRHGTLEIPDSGHALTINHYGVQKGTRRMVVLYWYQSGERVVANEFWAKAYLFWDTLTAGHTAGAIVRLVLPDEASLIADSRDFSAALIRELQLCLPGRELPTASDASREAAGDARLLAAGVRPPGQALRASKKAN
jgi:EpsI family protein